MASELVEIEERVQNFDAGCQKLRHDFELARMQLNALEDRARGLKQQRSTNNSLNLSTQSGESSPFMRSLRSQSPPPSVNRTSTAPFGVSSPVAVSHSSSPVVPRLSPRNESQNLEGRIKDVETDISSLRDVLIRRSQFSPQNGSPTSFQGNVTSLQAAHFLIAELKSENAALKLENSLFRGDVGPPLPQHLEAELEAQIRQVAEELFADHHRNSIVSYGPIAQEIRTKGLELVIDQLALHRMKMLLRRRARAQATSPRSTIVYPPQTSVVTSTPIFVESVITRESARDTSPNRAVSPPLLDRYISFDMHADSSTISVPETTAHEESGHAHAPTASNLTASGPCVIQHGPPALPSKKGVLSLSQLCDILAVNQTTDPAASTNGNLSVTPNFTPELKPIDTSQTSRVIPPIALNTLAASSWTDNASDYNPTGSVGGTTQRSDGGASHRSITMVSRRSDGGNSHRSLLHDQDAAESTERPTMSL